MSIREERFPRITRTPGVVGGEPCIAGTRVSVRCIVLYSRLYRDNPAYIESALPHITRAEIDEALAFYVENQAEIDDYIAANDVDEELLNWEPIILDWSLATSRR